MADVDGRPDPTQLPSRNLTLRIPDNPPVSPSSSSQQDQSRGYLEPHHGDGS